MLDLNCDYAIKILLGSFFYQLSFPISILIKKGGSPRSLYLGDFSL